MSNINLFIYYTRIVVVMTISMEDGQVQRRRNVSRISLSDQRKQVQRTEMREKVSFPVLNVF